MYVIARARAKARCAWASQASMAAAAAWGETSIGLALAATKVLMAAVARAVGLPCAVAPHAAAWVVFEDRRSQRLYESACQAAATLDVYALE